MGGMGGRGERLGEGRGGKEGGVGILYDDLLRRKRSSRTNIKDME
jgi:hypothetical protein